MSVADTATDDELLQVREEIRAYREALARIQAEPTRAAPIAWAALTAPRVEGWWTT